MPHPVIWFEVIGKDAAPSSLFLDGDLFDWELYSVLNDYFMVTTDGEAPSGWVGVASFGGYGHVRRLTPRPTTCRPRLTRPKAWVARR